MAVRETNRKTGTGRMPRKASATRATAKPPTRGARVVVTSFAGRTAEIPRPRFFATPRAWRAWLEKHHASRTELWVGFHRVATGKRSITWPQSVDEALCFGWIDGLRRGLDDSSYAIRFTPRKPASVWSRVNLKRFGELARAGRVTTAGRAAWGRRMPAHSGVRTLERGHLPLAAVYERRLRSDTRAWRFLSAQAPGYRKLCGHWVMRAKREVTRASRLAALLAYCRRGRPIPPLRWVRVKQPG